MSNKEEPINRSRYHREEDELMHAAPPLDYSFKNASTIEELVKYTAKPTRCGKLPDKTSYNRFLTSTLWLSNNALTSLAKLEDFASDYLENPDDLRWLDVAYNKLHDIDDELLKFRNITILYLHGNEISDMNTIVKLRKLKCLRTLTLHGNPIEKMPSYRRYVVAILPQIFNLDFSPVIETERRRALPPGFFKTIQCQI